MLRLALVLALLGGTAAAAPPYRPPADVAVALATFRTGAGQPAVEASRIVFARVPLVGMTASEARSLLGKPTASYDDDGDERWRYERLDGADRAVLLLRIRAGSVATVVSFPTE
jgi:hypothetical protein